MDEQHNLVQQPNSQTSAHHSLLFKATVVLISIISLLLLIAATVIISLSYAFQLASQNSQPPLPITTLPRQFGIHTATPVQNQLQRETCWDFTSMNFLEERYRVQGYKQGYMNESQYVRFSKQAHGVNMIDFCKLNNDKCPDTPEATGIARNGYNSWLYHFQSYLNDKLTVDMQTCPYTPNESNVTDQQCNGMKEFQQSKRIKYNVTNYKYLTNIDDIKRALFEKNQSMPLAIELFWLQYFVSCDSDKYFENTTQCKQKLQQCPEDLQNEFYNRSCANMSLFNTAEGEFITHRLDYTNVVGDHKMLLVGYNDDYQVANQTEGGFIVLNSWGAAQSHSLKYLLGQISRYDENYICPNVNSPNEWVPVNYDGENKWRLRLPTVLQLVTNNSVLGFKPGRFHTITREHYANALSNVKGLNGSAYYVINKIDDFTDRTVKVQLAVSNSSDPNQDFSKLNQFITLPAATLDYLSFFFAPVNYDSTMDNFEDQCGYYFIPYDMVKMAVRMKGIWSVDVMDVQFDKSSYIQKDDKINANGVWRNLKFKLNLLDI